MDKKSFSGTYKIDFKENSVIINPRYYDCIIISNQHKYTMIWLHGLGQYPSAFL